MAILICIHIIPRSPSTATKATHTNAGNETAQEKHIRKPKPNLYLVHINPPRPIDDFLPSIGNQSKRRNKPAHVQMQSASNARPTKNFAKIHPE